MLIHEDMLLARGRWIGAHHFSSSQLFLVV
jgi:hypothetical protein